MCLIAVAWRADAHHPLIVAANRDEAHDRPTAQATWWPDAPNVLGGRDLTAGGSWFAVDRSGRFAAVTNLRTAAAPAADSAVLTSRGALVADFLRRQMTAGEYAHRTANSASRYGAFNLLVCDGQELWFAGSLGGVEALPAGVHALSNVEPGVDWPKVETARRHLRGLLHRTGDLTAPLFELLSERGHPVDGYGIREVSPFQLDPVWGTRASTVLTINDAGWIRFTERSFDRNGHKAGEVAVAFERQTLSI